MKYFRYGTIGLAEKLISFVEDHQLTALMDTSVESVEIDTFSHRVTLTTDKGPITAGKFVLTSCAVLESIIVDGAERIIPSARRPLLQLHLTFQGPPISSLSFGQHANSPILLLSGNVTPFLKPDLIEKGFSLITNLVVNTLEHSEKNVHLIVDYFRTHKLIDDRHILIDALWKNHNVSQRQDDELEAVAKEFSPYIDILPTHSLGATIRTHGQRWREAIG